MYALELPTAGNPVMDHILQWIKPYSQKKTVIIVLILVPILNRFVILFLFS